MDEEQVDKAFDRDGITLYHGDNLIVMQHLIDQGVQVDLILTDPPYNVSHLNEGMKQPDTIRKAKVSAPKGQVDFTGVVGDGASKRSGTGRDRVRIFGEWDFSWSQKEVLPLFDQLLRPGGQLIAFTSELIVDGWLDTPFKHRGLIFWKKTNPVPAMPGLYVRPIEIAVWQTKGSKWTFNGGGYTMPIYEVPTLSNNEHSLTEPRIHPTQKPQELWRHILGVHAKPGDLVLDPFMGSGSSARAAMDMGMQYIGIDKGADENGIRWVDHAQTILRQQVLPIFG